MSSNLQLARYESASGKVFELQWRAVSRSSGHALATGDYPQYDGGDVLDLGHTIEQYPFQCFFYGDDVQRRADQFYSALLEQGVGKLSHPRWGTLSVIATSISQSEDYVESIGKITFDLTFVVAGETLALQAHPGDSQLVAQAANEVDELLMSRVADSPLNTAVFDKFNQAILAPLKVINTIAGNGWRLASAWQEKVNTLAMSLNGLLNTPALAVKLLGAFLSPLKQLGSGEQLHFLRSLKQVVQPSSAQSSSASGQFERSDEAQARINGVLVSQSLLTAHALQLAIELNDQLETREQARDLLMSVQALQASYTASMDDLFSSVTIQRQGMNVPLILAMNQMASVTKEAILGRLMGLKLVASRRLGHAMSCYEALYLLYGGVDEEQLAQLISLNNLSDEEIFLLPAGKELKYYAR